MNYELWCVERAVDPLLMLIYILIVDWFGIWSQYVTYYRNTKLASLTFFLVGVDVEDLNSFVAVQ